MTKQQIIERLVAHGIDPDDVPKIIGSDEPDVSVEIIVLGVPVYMGTIEPPKVGIGVRVDLPP